MEGGPGSGQRGCREEVRASWAWARPSEARAHGRSVTPRSVLDPSFPLRILTPGGPQSQPVILSHRKKTQGDQVTSPRGSQPLDLAEPRGTRSLWRQSPCTSPAETEASLSLSSASSARELPPRASRTSEPTDCTEQPTGLHKHVLTAGQGRRPKVLRGHECQGQGVPRGPGSDPSLPQMEGKPGYSTSRAQGPRATVCGHGCFLRVPSGGPQWVGERPSSSGESNTVEVEPEPDWTLEGAVEGQRERGQGVWLCGEGKWEGQGCARSPGGITTSGDPLEVEDSLARLDGATAPLLQRHF